MSSHCRLEAGSCIGEYTVLKRLGKGRFTTVWAAEVAAPGSPFVAASGRESVAIKVYRSGYDKERYYKNEIRVMRRISAAPTIAGHEYIVRYITTFAHVATAEHDVNIHPCIVYNELGSSLSDLIKFCKTKYEGGIPTPIVKKLMMQVILGLAYIHDCGVIHADIKPENILLDSAIESLSDDTLHINIVDFGSSSFTDSVFSRSVGTTPYVAPELLIDGPLTAAIDVWAALVMCYELITGDLLFDVYEECNTMYGSDVDGEAMDGLKSGSCDSVESIMNAVEALSMGSTDSSGDEIDVDQSKLNYRHLLLMVKLMGRPPDNFVANARTLLNIYGKPYDHPEVNTISITDLLLLNYDMNQDLCMRLEEFVRCGLKYLPEERLTARQLCQHPWLEVDEDLS